VACPTGAGGGACPAMDSSALGSPPMGSPLGLRLPPCPGGIAASVAAAIRSPK